MMKRLTCLVCILLIQEGLGNKTFVATDTWKTIEDGEAIPAGLHVRINLETGKKEAKLLEPEEKTAPNNVSSLMKIEENAGTPQETPSKTPKIAEKQDEKPKFKQNSRADVIADMISLFKEVNGTDNPHEAEKALALLTGLESIVHQFDDGIAFIRLDGIAKVVLRALKFSSAGARSAALRILGGASQNNREVQQAALTQACITTLFNFTLSEPEQSVRTKGIFALSCLTRGFPPGQVKFVQDGGITFLSKAFDKYPEVNMRMKISSFLAYFLTELESNAISQKQEEEYDVMKSDLNLLGEGWCKRSPDWLCSNINIQDMNTKEVNHDFIDAAVDLLGALAEPCLDDFVMNVELMSAVNHLQVFYEDLALRDLDEGLTDSFYTDIHRKLRHLAGTLARTTIFSDEL